MWGMHDVGTGWWIVMSLSMVGFWALVIWAIWRVTADRRVVDGRSGADETPTEILERRLAAGEITVAEYDARRDAIEGRVRPAA